LRSAPTELAVGPFACLRERWPAFTPAIYADAVRTPITSDVIDSLPGPVENVAMLRVAFAGTFAARVVIADNIRR